MPTLETAIRLIIIGQQLLIAAVILAGVGSRAPRISGVLLMLSFVGYVYASDEALVSAIPMLVPLVALLAIIVPYCLWLFARAVFEAPWPRFAYVLVGAGVAVATWIIFLAGVAVSDGIRSTSGAIARVVSLLVVGHAVWLTLRGRPDDLVENRRVFRLFFVIVISIQVAAVLVVELLLAGDAAPGWLDMTNIIVIELLTLGLAIPMLGLNAEFFESGQGNDIRRLEREASALGATERIYRQKLLDLMDGGYFQETGLTIPMLAGKLGYPEHQLRRLINGHLGFRNFTAFLNSYRIAEAKKRLSDPDQARTPVLTIALRLGYASLGPFNRAFKATTGMTPTDFRRQYLAATGADSE
jgi:AraC-like DNA-binding protein